MGAGYTIIDLFSEEQVLKFGMTAHQVLCIPDWARGYGYIEQHRNNY